MFILVTFQRGLLKSQLISKTKSIPNLSAQSGHQSSRKTLMLKCGGCEHGSKEGLKGKQQKIRV